MSDAMPTSDKKFLVLVQDTTTGKWSITVDSVYEEHADRLLESLRKTKDPSPVIKLDTSDFIQFHDPTEEGE